MSRRYKGRVHVSLGFCLLAAWFAMANGWRLLVVVLGAAAVHELGHVLALKCLGTSCGGLRVGVLGAELEIRGGRLSYGGELACVLAGPGANLLCALALAAGGETVLAGAHLTLCLFNLLPVRPLDGGRALYLAVSWLAGPGAGERAARWVGAMTGALLGTALVWLMGRSGGSLWLLPPAVAALYLAVREGAAYPGFFL